ncbi:hypothetical protein NLJ89_g5810 [Agrocybe chaxingu]|uniref:HECT domain-containing protein n=1 Tax=Agrocybe chaxingu TaxID=84603 RepID=A0A9W8MX06_9AGAR|nr:hypothetical protein NLJ89_g5810 [Agrocybe chaxingu]
MGEQAIPLLWTYFNYFLSFTSALEIQPNYAVPAATHGGAMKLLQCQTIIPSVLLIGEDTEEPAAVSRPPINGPSTRFASALSNGYYMSSEVEGMTLFLLNHLFFYTDQIISESPATTNMVSPLPHSTPNVAGVASLLPSLANGTAVPSLPALSASGITLPPPATGASRSGLGMTLAPPIASFTIQHPGAAAGVNTIRSASLSRIAQQNANAVRTGNRPPSSSNRPGNRPPSSPQEQASFSSGAPAPANASFLVCLWPGKASKIILFFQFILLIRPVQQPFGADSTSHDWEMNVDLKVNMEELTSLLLRLHEHQLVFPLSYPVNIANDDLLRLFSTQITTHLSRFKYHLVTHAEEDPAAVPSQSSNPALLYAIQNWVVLKNRKNGNYYKFIPHPGMNVNVFSPSELNKLNGTFPNPLPQFQGHSLIIIAPKHGLLKGPISQFPDTGDLSPHEPHPCIMRRILTGLRICNVFITGTACVTNCPQDITGGGIGSSSGGSGGGSGSGSGSSGDSSGASNVRPRSQSAESQLSAQAPTRNRRRLDHTSNETSAVQMQNSAFAPTEPDVQIPVSFPSTTRAQSSVPQVPAAIQPPQVPQYLDSDEDDELPQIIPQARDPWADVGLWSCRVLTTIRLRTRKTLRFHGKDVEGVGMHILDILAFFEKRKLNPQEALPDLPDDIYLSPLVHQDESLFLTDRSRREFLLGLKDNAEGLGQFVTTGPGPERGCMRSALRQATEDPASWTSSQHTAPDGQHLHGLVPIFHGLGFATPDYMMLRYAAYGRILALHLIWFQRGADVTFWLPAILTIGPDALLVPHSLIQEVDPILAAKVEPWFKLKPEEPLPAFPRAPVCALLSDVLEIDPRIVQRSRSQEQHNAYTIHLLSSLLFNHKSPWDTPEFKAIQSGFNLVLDIRQSTTSRLINRTQDLGREKLVRLFAAMFSKDLAETIQVTSQIGCYPDIAAEYRVGVLLLLASVFNTRLTSYLQGIGHPPSARDTIVSVQDWERDKDDHLFRCRLFLKAVTDADLVPSKEIKILLSWPISPEDLSASFTEWHTCSMTANIPVTKHLFQMLLTPLGEGEVSHKEFDSWFHAQLLNQDGYSIL